MAERPVYLDCQATTPLDPRVVSTMVEAFDLFGNPHGRQHAYGREAADAVDAARVQVAGLIGAYPEQIVFTSGATESCNLALRGVARAASPQRRRIVTLATEHAAVLDTVRDLGERGFEVTVLPVEADGVVDLNRVEDAVDDRTLIVSAMAVNNEIGVLQPVTEMAYICHRHGALFHTDAVQSAGKLPLAVDRLGVDLLSLSAHKLNGPKGVGALWVRRGVRLVAGQTGGGQERSRRAGTENVPGIAGFGTAARLAAAAVDPDRREIAALRDRLETGILENVPGTVVNGDREQRVPNTTNISFEGIEAESLLIALDL